MKLDNKVTCCTGNHTFKALYMIKSRVGWQNPPKRARLSIEQRGHLKKKLFYFQEGEADIKFAGWVRRLGVPIAADAIDGKDDDFQS